MLCECVCVSTHMLCECVFVSVAERQVPSQAGNGRAASCHSRVQRRYDVPIDVKSMVASYLLFYMTMAASSAPISCLAWYIPASQTHTLWSPQNTFANTHTRIHLTRSSTSAHLPSPRRWCRPWMSCSLSECGGAAPVLGQRAWGSGVLHTGCSAASQVQAAVQGQEHWRPLAVPVAVGSEPALP